MKTVTVIDSGGNAFPVGGCYTTFVSVSAQSYYVMQLRVVTPSGKHEYQLMQTNSRWGSDWPVPKDMAAMRDRIVAALADDNIELLDLRVEEPQVSAETTAEPVTVN